MRAINLCLMVGLVGLGAGCATITGSETQPVSITTQTDDGQIVEAARCSLRNDKGAWSTISPGFVNVGRSAEDLVIECRKASQPDGFARAISRAHGGMWGNIIFGGGIGAIIDHSKGTGYEYPNTVPVRMGRSIVIDRSTQAQVQEEPVAPGAATRSTPAPPASQASASQPVAPSAPSPQPAIASSPNTVAPSESKTARDSAYSGIQFPAHPGPLPQPTKISEISYEVEKLARSKGCSVEKAAELLTEPGHIETYRVRCSAGSELIVKCEYRTCRILQ